tara:strand:- start:106 stop:288 length:183 start_codon:yes stop_codon:yes gene_type:complete
MVLSRHSAISSIDQLERGNTNIESGKKIIKKDIALKKTNINPKEYLISFVTASPSGVDYT